jgi:hypothetical protein
MSGELTARLVATLLLAGAAVIELLEAWTP